MPASDSEASCSHSRCTLSCYSQRVRWGNPRRHTNTHRDLIIYLPRSQESYFIQVLTWTWGSTSNHETIYPKNRDTRMFFLPSTHR